LPSGNTTWPGGEGSYNGGNGIARGSGLRAGLLTHKIKPVAIVHEAHKWLRHLMQ
jgi:hypothetical protein